MEMVSSKNVEEVVMLLKKELSKTVDQDYEKVLMIYIILVRNFANITIEQRIQAATNSLDPRLCH